MARFEIFTLDHTNHGQVASHALYCPQKSWRMSVVAWSVFGLMGIVAFSVSGAIVAMEENYDIFGMFVLGFVTSFGGGVMRNLLIGISLLQFWEQSVLFNTCFITLILLIFVPPTWIHHSKQWIILFDALGLSSFAIQGALYAVSQHMPLNAIVLAAVITGIGGSMLRDILANRKPFVLREEIYAVWAALVGVVIGLGWVKPDRTLQLYALFAAIFTLRMLSVRYQWKFPRKAWGLSRDSIGPSL